jgi:glycosyltransferase involved in cell wall biosynthesis
MTRRSLRSTPGFDKGVQHWGANAVEIEFMRYRPRLELTMALSEYDLIHVVAGGPALAAAVLKTRAEVPVVLQAATIAAWERESRFLTQSRVTRTWRQGMTKLTSRMERHALREVDMVLVLNEVMLKHVRSLGQDHVIKAPPGVNTQLFTPGPGGWQSSGHLLSVCRLGDPRKGLDRMVLAYSEMLRADKRVPDLVLAGRGNLDPATRELIWSLGLTSRVHVHADVAASELVPLYQNASVFLLTSHEEGLGISVLEAMACGLPVVCTDNAGTRETVADGSTGWLVEQGGRQFVADQVAKQVLATLDGRGASMGTQGRDRCLRLFSLDVTLHRLTAIYDELTARLAG